MAPHPDAAPVAIPHYGGRRRCDDDDDVDANDDPRWLAWCSSATAGLYPTATDAFLADSTSAVGVGGGGGGLGSIKPVVIIVPILAGLALLLLAIGGFLVCRKRKRARSAADSDAASATEMRGGAMAMGEKYNPNEEIEIPPRYEDSARDRSVSVATSSQGELYRNPFADPEPEYTPPVSPVSAAAVAEGNIVTDGGMRGARTAVV